MRALSSSLAAALLAAGASVAAASPLEIPAWLQGQPLEIRIAHDRKGTKEVYVFAAGGGYLSIGLGYPTAMGPSHEYSLNGPAGEYCVRAIMPDNAAALADLVAAARVGVPSHEDAETPEDFRRIAAEVADFLRRYAGVDPARWDSRGMPVAFGLIGSANRDLFRRGVAHKQDIACFAQLTGAEGAVPLGRTFLKLEVLDAAPAGADVVFTVRILEDAPELGRTRRLIAQARLRDAPEPMFDCADVSLVSVEPR